MELDREICFRASASRDARFDGRFFIGVQNDRGLLPTDLPGAVAEAGERHLYATAAAAEAAGLRPCRRCRPETAPGTPEWLGGSAVVARALRLIDDGLPRPPRRRDRSPASCASSERQLRRLFEAHLGAPPGAVARTRRLRLARQLIDQTDLSMADVSRCCRLHQPAPVQRGRPLGLRPLRRGSCGARDVDEHQPGSSYGSRTDPRYAWDELIGFPGRARDPLGRSGGRRRAPTGAADRRGGRGRRGRARGRGTSTCAPTLRRSPLLPVSRSVAVPSSTLRADPVGIAESLGGDPTLGPLVSGPARPPRPGRLGRLRARGAGRPRPAGVRARRDDSRRAPRRSASAIRSRSRAGR